MSILLTPLMAPAFQVIPLAPGLDPSFVYAFNYAAVQGLRWGQDFISTFGPYGYVLSTMDVGDLLARKALISLLLAAGMAVATTIYLHSAPRLQPGGRLILLVGLIYACSIQGKEGHWSVFLLLILLISLHEDGSRALTAWAVAGLLSGFYVLMKFSLGFGALLALGFGCLLVRRPSSIAYRSVIALGTAPAGFLIGWIPYQGSLAGIGAYLTTGWEMSWGYSSAMSHAPDGWWIGATSFLVWLSLLTLWAFLQRGPRTLLSLAALAPTLFVMWKHSIVRQDNHVLNLITFGIFVMTILLIEARAVWSWRSTLPAAGALLIPLVTPWYSLPSEWREWWAAGLKGRPCYAASIEGTLSRPLKLCGGRDLATLAYLVAYRHSREHESSAALQEDVLPRSIRSIVGGSSVDVYPWEINYVPANGLSWANRPLPASFNTYTPALDSLNAAFFQSQRRPDYLLWHTSPHRDATVASIDGRHLFWDEPRTLRAILDSYDLVAADPSAVLLRARARPRFAPPRAIGTQQVAWNTWASVPHAPGVLLAHASIQRVFVMTAIRTVFRENAIFLSLRFASGDEARYRIVPDNSSEGMWLSPLPVTVGELHSLLRAGQARPVVAVRFSTGRLARFYRPITISWSQLAPVDGTWDQAQH